MFRASPCSQEFNAWDWSSATTFKADTQDSKFNCILIPVDWMRDSKESARAQKSPASSSGSSKSCRADTSLALATTASLCSAGRSL
eukprot:12887507-Alexandrium_andersonii.AAC.1